MLLSTHIVAVMMAEREGRGGKEIASGDLQVKWIYLSVP